MLQAALQAIKSHLVAIKADALGHFGVHGYLLTPAQLKGVIEVVKATRPAREGKGRGGKSLQELMAEASKHPELREALASLGAW